MEKDFLKTYSINISDNKTSDLIIKALNSPTRRKILMLLEDGPISIWNIALKLDVPLSTISEHVALLIKSGLVSVVRKESGSKIVSRQYERVMLSMISSGSSRPRFKVHNVSIPIGSYSSFRIHHYCGMLSEEGYIGKRDDADSFYSLQRFDAQLIWFDSGYLEYTVPVFDIDLSAVTSLALSMELCSEFPGYNNSWKSDIYFEINEKEVCVYTSPGDFGDRNGVYTPSWWAAGTQYGMMVNLTVCENGTFLDGKKASDVCISDVIGAGSVVRIRIGVHENARHPGGINLFGEKFGDHPQHIMLSFSY